MAGQARAGPVTERMVGPRHPLQPRDKALIATAWHAAAARLRFAHGAEIMGERARLWRLGRQARHRDEAAVRQAFAHRFLIAMQETCIDRRNAALVRLYAEQAALVAGARQRAAAETSASVPRGTAPLKARHREDWQQLREAARAARRRRRVAVRPLRAGFRRRRSGPRP